MSNISVLLLLVAVLLATLDPISAQGGNMCGMNAPDPMKTCISIRLPWQVEPIHFCIEKEKFRYRNQCTSGSMMHCGSDMMRNDTLLVATPWDCCPYSSVPDHCMHHQCPPAPMNRQCQIISTANSQYSTWDCCPKYFCEENSSPENCHMKRLDPTCVNPPKDKMKCVGFYDPYGCCTKYQCDGEGKPGMCPMQQQAMMMMMRWNASMSMNSMMMGQMGGNMMPPPASRSDQMAGEGRESIVQRMTMMPNMPMSMSMDCVMDGNCPGTMKCCSHDMSVYYPTMATGGQMNMMHNGYGMRNMNPTHGYCMEPLTMATAAPAAGREAEANKM